MTRPRHLRPGTRTTRNAALRSADLATAAAAFAAPPSDARPMVRWWWFGPAQTEAMIDHDLAVISAAGLAGAELAVVYPLADGAGEPETYSFGSPELLARVGYAAEQAHALGLRLDLTLSGGWSYGGPHITRERGAKRLRWETTELAPTERSFAVPAATPGETLVAAYLGPGTLESFPPDLPVLDGAAPGRVIDLPPHPGPRVLALAWCTPTWQTVKRAPLGGEGYVLDHYDAEATRLHLDAVAVPLLDAEQAGGPDRVTAVFCDSLEVFYAAGALTDRNPWWPVMPALTTWLARLGAVAASVRRSGRSACTSPTESRTPPCGPPRAS